MRIKSAQLPRDSSVKRRTILWRNPLPIGLFTQFNSFETVIAPQQIINLSGSILRRVVQHPDRYKHRQVVRKRATQNEIESRLLDAEVDVFCSMPRISG